MKRKTNQKQFTKAKKAKIEYRGYRVTNDELDVVDPDKISAKEFFEKYVLKRKPCILSRIKLNCDDSVERVMNWQNLEYLEEKAGDICVQIEKKVNEQFGSGEKRETVEFKEFISRLKEGREDYYMTTQYETEQSNSYCQVPLNGLIDDFPKRPFLLPSLIPQQVNLWMGACSDPKGTSSGLHHDFADNLYVLLKGTKKFTLYDPSQIESMYTVDKPFKVYENGYIVYGKYSSMSQVPRMDGADPLEVAKWQVEEADKRLENGDDSAEELLDQAMKKVLELETMPFNPEETIHPPSFSQISIDSISTSTATTATSTTASKFPLHSNAKSIEIKLNQGQMLYLPTGWFHEVISIGTSTDPIHMAFNYWFHAPSAYSFDYPYTDDYWLNCWKTIEKLKPREN